MNRSSRHAAALLGIHRDSLRLAIEQPLGQKFLKWRWSGPRHGKRIFEMESVRAYLEALKEEGK